MDPRQEAANQLAAAYRQKAKTSYEAAVLLAKNNANSAANRLYYALYQGGVSKLEEMRQDPNVIDPLPKGSVRETRWRHAFLAQRWMMTQFLDLEVKDADLFKRTKDYRVQADYSDRPVLHSDIDDLLKQAKTTLARLGVKV